MSWNNVKGVSAAKIWTDNPDITKAYLFANGNHQVKLTVAVSFVLSNTAEAGPTEDEVKAAITLIDYQTAAGLSHLKTGDKGAYAAVYQPNSPVTIKAVEDSNTGAYQYEFDYYISSDSTINASYMSEEVALLISYTGSDGKPVSYSTASGSKSQSYVAVTVEPPKKYGMSGSNMTPVVFNTLDDKFQASATTVSSWINHLYETSAILYSLRIDDSYFKIINFITTNTPESPNACLQHTISNFSDDNDYEYVFAHSFLIANKPLLATLNVYSTNLDIMSSDSWILIEYSGQVSQSPGELIFAYINSHMIYAKGGPGPIAESSGPATLTAYDQFGNDTDIVINSDDNGYPKLASVN